MDTIRTAAFIEAVTKLLEEIHVGPPDPRTTWIASNRENSGLLGMLEGISARAASTPPGHGLNTIAAHAGHLLYALSLALRSLQGEDAYAGAKWAESWGTQTVDEASWQGLRAGLRRVHEGLLAALRTGPVLDDPLVLQGVIALVGHGAYHLGAIQATLRVLGSG
jgi:uncharacterized damage-inducible protein DinB